MLHTHCIPTVSLLHIPNINFQSTEATIWLLKPTQTFMLHRQTDKAPERFFTGFPSAYLRWNSASLLFTVLLLLLLALSLLQSSWLSPPPLRLLVSFVLTWWLPGLLLLRIVQPPDVDSPTALLLSIGLGLGWMMGVALILYHMLGPISQRLLIASYTGGALLLGIINLWLHPSQQVERQRAPEHDGALSVRVWLLLLLLFGVALLLRLPGLGYHELHVDEVTVLRAARRVIEGVPNVLAQHTKGPGEILVSVVGYRLLGNIDESTARLPFALMSVAGVLALMLLGRRIFSAMIGFWAGILLALNGFALGLSRIAQYQGGMLLLTILAAYASWEFAERSKGRWLLLSIAFTTFGSLLHYEFLLMLPLLGVLVLRGWRRSNERLLLTKIAFVSGASGAILLLVSYIPLLLDESFARTQGYLSNRLGDLTNFNGAFFVEMGTFYNSIYFFVGVFLLVLLGIEVGWRTHRAAILLLILWILPNFLLYLFIMRFPGTHFYTMTPVWSLLAAIGVVYLLTGGTSNSDRFVIRRWVMLIIVCGWVIISANYLRLIFFQQEPEYVINYQALHSPFYWAPYGVNIPEKPRFGFPIREGWKAAGILAKWGYLGESYASNERSRHLRRWYLESISRQSLQDLPDTVFVAHHLQARDPSFDDNFLERNYQRVGEIRVRGEAHIDLWQREPLPAPYVSYDAESFEQAFDGTIPILEEAVIDDLSPHVVDGRLITTAVELSDALWLDGAWMVAAKDVARGDLLHLAFVWRAQQQLQRDYKVFVHIVDDTGDLRTQWDGYPGQNSSRTTEWAVGEPFVDHLLLRMPMDLPAATYQIMVGLYDEETGERVGGRAIDIGEVLVK